MALLGVLIKLSSRYVHSGLVRKPGRHSIKGCQEARELLEAALRFALWTVSQLRCKHLLYVLPRTSAISDPGQKASRGHELHALPSPVGRNKSTVTAKPKLLYIRYLIVNFENPSEGSM